MSMQSYAALCVFDDDDSRAPLPKREFPTEKLPQLPWPAWMPIVYETLKAEGPLGAAALAMAVDDPHVIGSTMMVHLDRAVGLGILNAQEGHNMYSCKYSLRGIK